MKRSYIDRKIHKRFSKYHTSKHEYHPEQCSPKYRELLNQISDLTISNKYYSPIITANRINFYSFWINRVSSYGGVLPYRPNHRYEMLRKSYIKNTKRGLYRNYPPMLLDNLD